MLYVLYAEVLACNIRANHRIIGLSLPGSTSLLPVVSQYAVDTSLIVTTNDSIKAVFDTYSVFELGSGSKLNLSKSKGFWLGGWNGRLDPPISLEWTSGMIKVLGVFIGLGEVEEANWRPRINAVDNTLNSWRQRHLSYHGRPLVLNALALSRIWYVASLVHMPDWVLRELNTLIFTFFRKGKRDLVAQNVVCQPSLLGGFSVVSVTHKAWALHVQWARHLVTCPAARVLFYTFIFGIVLVRLLWMFFPGVLPSTLAPCPLSIALSFLLGVLWMGGFLLVMAPSPLEFLLACLYLQFVRFPRIQSIPFFV